MSDHYVTWGEVVDFLNNVAWRIGKDFRHLYTGTLAQTIMRKREEVSLVESRYTYEVSPELATEPALLSLATMQRYVNWRESHYWRYSRLLNQEKGIADRDDNFVRYFKKQFLWPMIDLAATPVIDNLYDIVEKSTEVGTYCFSADGSHVERIEPEASYRFPTQEEIQLWKSLLPPGNVWDVTSRENTKANNCSALSMNGESVESVQECYGLLALNTKKMESDSNFQKEEETLQGERAHFEEFLQQDLLQSANFTAAYNQDKEGYEQADLATAQIILNILDGATLISAGFAFAQGFHWAVVLRCCVRESSSSFEEGSWLLSNEEKVIYNKAKEHYENKMTEYSGPDPEMQHRARCVPLPAGEALQTIRSDALESAILWIGRALFSGFLDACGHGLNSTY